MTTHTDGLPKSRSDRGPVPVTLFACFGVRTSKLGVNIDQRPRFNNLKKNWVRH